ncbi:hypothetical protein MHU86_17742 [Fragilaria crotonensis]|nr:hypothetical protein MHU86_17742 [Fragilaria crotonensis]
MMYLLYRNALFLIIMAVALHVTSAMSGEERDLQLSACPNPGSTIPPTHGSTCSVDPTTVCKYDKVCCCANCIDRFRCSCVNGSWECLQVALDCLPGTCPPTPAAAVPSPPPTPRPTSNPVPTPTRRPTSNPVPTPTRRPTGRRTRRNFFVYH